MEFGLREWMILISGLLIIVVIVDGVRRMLADRRNHMRMGMSYDDVEDDEYFDDNPELPNGGARIVTHRTEAGSEPVIGSLDIDDEQLVPRQPFAARSPAPVTTARSQRPDELELLSATRELDSDPLALDPLVGFEETERGSSVPAGVAEATSDAPDAPKKKAKKEARKEAKKETERGQRERLRMPSFKRSAPPPEAAATESVVIADQEPVPETDSKTGSAERSAGDKEDREQDNTAKSPAADQPQEVLVINVFARDNNGFNGGDLLEVLLACDVRFGEMKIFHRYESSKGSGPVQFSIANLVKPGTFELDTIKEFYTPGITMFMQLPGPVDPLAAFDCMAEVASCIVRNLQGEMRDEGHSVLTQQTLEHYRERIRNFERKRLMRGQRKA